MKNNKNIILLKELVKTDFKLRYQGSVMGYVWSVLKPLMLFAVMYVVFIYFLRFGADVPHFAVALLLGMVLWSFFTETLTGKENVYLNGAMLGFSKNEIDDMYNDIVEFSELHDFMNQKLKNYSSGMQVRLAFAVAIQAKSDILVLDEILAVGDEAFQRKCNDYFLDAKKSDKTVILVTHSMDAVRKYCNKAVLIDKGEIKIFGTPNDVANQYSLDNVQQSGSATVIEPDDTKVSNQNKVDEIKIESEIRNVEVKLLSKEIINETDRKVRFSVAYECLLS